MSGEPRNNDVLRPQSPEVYRRRRIVALVLLVLVVAIIVGLVWWIVSLFRPASVEAPAGPTNGVTAPAATAPPTAFPTDAHSEPAGDGTASPPAEAASPSGTPDASGSESPAASGTPSDGETADAAGPTSCQPGDLVISAATDQQAYGDGEDPVLELRVDNTGQEPCETNLGTSQQVFTVYSGSDRIFSTEDCQVDGQDATMEIAPDEQERSRVTWPRVRSAPECEQVDVEPRSGTYRLEVSLGELTAQPVTFTLR